MKQEKLVLLTVSILISALSETSILSNRFTTFPSLFPDSSADCSELTDRSALTAEIDSSFNEADVRGKNEDEELLMR